MDALTLRLTGGAVNFAIHFWEVFSLLVAETVLPATIGALPGDPVAGHGPDIFMHAVLANAKAAAAAPAEWDRGPAAVALGPICALFFQTVG
jgi:hypothetical protein